MTFKIPMAQPDLTLADALEITECIRRGWISMGPLVHRFEEKFAERLGVKHAIATSSGTAALHLALLAAGVKPGDRVLVPTLTYVATVAAVRYCGAVPVFCDSDRETWGMAPDPSAITVATRAVPVHLYGVPHMFGANREGIVEDAAEALGGTYDGRPCGTLGKLGVFSFYANKILTTGEGGMVVTDDQGLAEEVRLLRGQGQSPDRRYWHTRVGFNYRMTDIQAALGIGQLERLDEMLAARYALLTRYRANLMADGPAGVTWQTLRPGTTRAPWVFACLLPDPLDGEWTEGTFRDHVANRLAEHGIETRPTFPCVHEMPPYQEFAWPTENYSHREQQAFPIAEDISSRGLLLPLFSQMTVDQVDEVCDRLLGLL